MDEQFNVFKPITLTTQQKDVYNKETFNYDCSMKYYYENPNDMKSVKEGGLNLPSGHRPWFSFEKKIETDDGGYITELISGRDAFNDPALYRPKDLARYINNHFVEPYEEANKPSPFMYHRGQRKTGKGFQLNPQQKFLGQFVSNDTDFPGVLAYHGIGAGKTAAATATALAHVAKYKAGPKMKDIPGRKISIKNDKQNQCSVLLVVPKNLLNDYVDTFMGKVQNGEFVSVTSMCVIYCEKDKVSDYNEYRQIYQGTIRKNSEGVNVFENPNLQKLSEFEDDIEQFASRIADIQSTLAEKQFELTSEEKNKMIRDIQQLQKELDTKTKQYEALRKTTSTTVSDLFLIVSHETFISRLKQQVSRRGGRIEYTVSDFVLGKTTEFITTKGTKISIRGNPDRFHPDFLHSNKSLIIIDEIQKLVSEHGSNYYILYNTLFVNARSYITGKRTTKVVLMTATPTHNSAFQMAAMINLIPTRLQFPRNPILYNSMFVDLAKSGIKNKILHTYMLSGYVSYLKGGSTEGYPYRRNNVVLHKMGEVQYTQYFEKMKIDLDDILKKKKAILTNVFDESENSVINIYRNSRNISMIALPTYSGSSQETELRSIIAKGKFGDYSSKLKNIADMVMNTEGPVFIYSGYIKRGLLPLIYYFEHMGYEFIGKNGNFKLKPNVLKNQKKLRYTIWSGTLYTEFKKIKNRQGFEIPEDESEFRSVTKSLFNSVENTDGSVCKIIFGNITEGVSFERVKAIHNCEPWWNESKMEQIIGRGIRFGSHLSLPPELQYIDVYYHCSVLRTYPEKDEEAMKVLGLNLKKCEYCKANKLKSFVGAITGENKNNKKVVEDVKEDEGPDFLTGFVSFEEFKKTGEVKKTVAIEQVEMKKENKGHCTCDKIEQKTYSTSASISIEQRLFMIAHLKNSINKQFEMCMKEAAVDHELNKYGNVSRLEEFRYPGLNENDKIMYDRTTNKYYRYEKDGALSNITFNSFESAWPPTEYKVEGKFENKDILYAPISTRKDDKGNLMVYIDLLEEINSFNNNPEYKDKNFYELKEYAVNVKGEESSAWEEIERIHQVNELITVLSKNNSLTITPSILLDGFKNTIDIKKYLSK